MESILKKINVKFFLQWVIACTWPSIAAAASFFVTDVKTSDANPDLAKSLKILVTSSISNNGGTVVEVEGQADYLMQPELVRLGQAYILTVTKVGKDKSAYTTKQKATSVEELDDASDRAVRAAMNSVNTKKDLRVGEVKEHDQEVIKRRISSRGANYFAFGPSTFTAMQLSVLCYDFAYGHFWEVTPHAALRLIGEAAFPGDFKSYFAHGELGINYYLSDSDHSVYFGGGLGFGGAGSTGSSITSVGGFSGTVGLGILLFRTSTSQFDLSLNYSSVFANNSVGVPGLVTMRIGMQY